ncbi:MAG: uroporphyrinogen decarboxylase family protein [Oligoflexia bacterium]|nr:uroporphyrinogen decarboxylase family protein [Oligoflexia bacterium]
MANEKFQNAIKRVVQKVPPIWFMRQAGRYHKHYQKLRAQHSFMELCKNPELAALVAMGPIEDFDFDVSILFSDLLFPLEALGMGLTYGDQGPELGWQLNKDTLKKLGSVDDAIPQLEFQKTAMQLTRQMLPQSKSLIGFVGGPWTLFSYAVQGSHDGNLTKAKNALDIFPRFCEKMIPLLKENIQLQFDGGAEIIMVFDTAAGELAPEWYKHLIVPELKKLSESFPHKLGYYSKATQKSHLTHDVFTQGKWAGIGFDHRWDLNESFQMASHGFVQGNFDQSFLFGTRDEFKNNLGNYLDKIKSLSPEQRAGWVSGLGHGVLPQTPEENVRLFVQTIREVMG